MSWPDLKTSEILTIIALLAGPIIAVCITLWHQDRREKRSAKERLFISLMAHRKSVPPTVEWASALNLIDVVYADHPRVVRLWHDLYETLNTLPLNMQRYTHQQLEMLSEIAQVLGYKDLQQTDIDKFYAPQAHGDQANLVGEVQRELLRVLKDTKSLHANKR